MKKGLTLIEILVAAITLATVVTGSAVTFSSVKRLSHRFAYRYTALNLAKDVLEFGEAARFTTGRTMRYEYSSGYGQYRVTSATGFDPSTEPHPFTFNCMGDIKAKGLVPSGAPESVVITYDVVNSPSYYGALMHTVKITWKEDPDDPEQKLVLGVLPITQVNNQIDMEIGELLWN